MRIAYITTAQQGAGHFTRGVAIGRGLRRVGFDGDFRIFSPPLRYPLGDGFPYTPFRIQAADALHPERARTNELALALEAFDPDLVLVDLYWYAVQHVLAGLDCEAWLLVRCVPRNWFAPRQLELGGTTRGTHFDPKRYARIVAIEPLWQDFFTDFCSPIVVANPDECQPPSALRQRLEVPSGSRLVMVTHAGLDGEAESMHADPLPGDVVGRLDLFEPGTLYPACEWLSGADLVYSGAGYNSYWESTWLGYYDRTRFTAFPRAVDWQDWRLKTCHNFPMKQNGADQLGTWIVGKPTNLLTRVVRGTSRLFGHEPTIRYEAPPWLLESGGEEGPRE